MVGDAEQLGALARRLAPQLARGDVIALCGPLGAGKTTLVRALVAALGGDPERVSSPTFTLVHHYQAEPPVVHVDAYRLTGADELADLGFDELREGHVACVEWAERVMEALPVARWSVLLAYDAGGRRIAVAPPPGRAVTRLW